jgi:hypothetical protein|tara:strand:- start:524 stop:676 length:153 start_codon:yes stop_codon:yes gene_type:complete
MSNTKKEKQLSWSEMCYKVDPSLAQPVPTYVFNNGNKVFYSPPKRIKGKK